MKQHRVYNRLRQAIYSGRLKPGDRLVERKLATEFATSRMPLRESLLQLMGEGLIRRSPRRVSYVEDLTQGDVEEIWQLRLALEPLGARLAAGQPDRRFVKRLRTLIERLARQVDQGKLVAAAETDLKFHREIIVASRSTRLLRAYDSIHVPMLMARMQPAIESQMMRRVHEEVVEPIERGDPARAERAARRHIKETIARDRKLLGVCPKR